MKENINNLTAALIIICIMVLSYNYINTEKEENTKEISKEEVIVVEDLTTINQVVISGKIKWPRNREIVFQTPQKNITSLDSTYVDWIGRFNLTVSIDSFGLIFIHHGKEIFGMYCSPNDTVHITMDAKQSDFEIAYSGTQERDHEQLLNSRIKESINQVQQIISENSIEAKETESLNNQVVISGKIKFPKNREARFFTRDTSITAYVDWIGKFNLTFPLDSSGYITFHHGDETTAMYCNPDDTVHITINTKQFDETITYTGSEESTFLAWRYLYIDSIGYPDVKNILDTTELIQQLDDFINPMLLESMSSKDMSVDFIGSQVEEYMSMRNYFLSQYEKNQKMLEMIGEAAIDFTYPDMDSNMISLSDFKGSYVYVDIWATWCSPCKYEIPFLVQLEKDYHDENIIFMSISVDAENAKQKWIDMINEKDMRGVQLISTDGWKSQIMKDYAINGIPRFMLFDRESNVISVDAPRPSSEEIRDIFDGFKNIKNQTETVENSEEETVNL